MLPNQEDEDKAGQLDTNKNGSISTEEKNRHLSPQQQFVVELETSHDVAMKLLEAFIQRQINDIVKQRSFFKSHE